jgi:hypothetical protein
VDDVPLDEDPVDEDPVDVEPVDVEPDVDEPDVPVDVLELLLFLLASVSALATVAKARVPTAVALSSPPVTKPTRRSPWSRVFMGGPPEGRAHRRGA